MWPIHPGQPPRTQISEEVQEQAENIDKALEGLLVPWLAFFPTTEVFILYVLDLRTSLIESNGRDEME